MTVNNFAVELGERVIAAMYEENNGNKYTRQHKIAERAFDARVAASTKPFEVCSFRNDYGWCKLESGHSGKHTVIFLGNDEEYDETENKEESEHSSSNGIPSSVWFARLGISYPDPDREI